MTVQMSPCKGFQFKSDSHKFSANCVSAALCALQQPGKSPRVRDPPSAGGFCVGVSLAHCVKTSVHLQ